jgi:hypothetical protein
LAAVIALSAFACGDGSPPSPAARVYTGAVDDSDAWVGVIATEHRARLFFCGGPVGYELMTRWITADINAEHQLGLPSDAAANWRIGGKVTDAEVTGSIDIGDSRLRSFHATMVSERTISGLYEGTASCGRLGLIVIQPTPDSIAAGQGACVGPVLEQVNPLEPIVRDPDGAIHVTVGSSTAEREVRAAAPPAD